MIEKKNVNPPPLFLFTTRRMVDRNLAKMIYELAKKDETLDGIELQELYKKKIKMDSDEQREKLKLIVSDFIKKNYQPVRNTLCLSDTMITGGKPTLRTHQHVPDLKRNEMENNMFVFKFSNDHYVEVVNRESQNLIKYAILPLNLKWRILYGALEISWAHWNEV